MKQNFSIVFASWDVGSRKEIGDEEPCYSAKILIFSFIWAGLCVLVSSGQARLCVRQLYCAIWRVQHKNMIGQSRCSRVRNKRTHTFIIFLKKIPGATV